MKIGVDMYKAENFLLIPSADSKQNKEKKENFSAKLAYSMANNTAAAMPTIPASTQSTAVAVTTIGIDIKQSAEVITTQYVADRVHPNLEHHYRFKIRAAHFEELVYFDSWRVQENKLKALMRVELKKIHEIELEIANYENVLAYSIKNLEKPEYINFFLHFRHKMATLQLLQKKINPVLSNENRKQGIPILEDVLGMAPGSHLSSADREEILNGLHKAIEVIFTILSLYDKVIKCSQDILQINNKLLEIAELMRHNIASQQQLKNDALSTLIHNLNIDINLRMHAKLLAQEQLGKYINAANSPQSALNKFDKLLEKFADPSKNTKKFCCLVS